MSVDQDERTLGAFRTVADLDVEAFDALCEREVDLVALPTASEIVRKVPVYTAAALISAAATDRWAIMAELNGCILDGPGALAVRDAIDPTVVDAASAVYRELIDEEAAAGRSAGDHFAAPGKNERLWNSFQKLSERAPSTFVAYFANPVLDLVCESWLGPGYRMTAQVNVVHPGGEARRPRFRDYHLGFLSDDEAARYPLPMHRASALLTLQGAVAHSDMAVESGPTRLLPFSQCYDLGFLAYRNPAFEDYFTEHFVQLPLRRGDLLFFNPALFHAAGDNRTADVVRTADLLQVSSAFGKPMETIDTTGIILRCFPDLQALHRRGTEDELAAALTMVADGYPFPGNLDSTPPTGGLAPPSQRDVVRQALDEGWSFEQLASALATQQAARGA